MLLVTDRGGILSKSFAAVALPLLMYLHPKKVPRAISKSLVNKNVYFSSSGPVLTSFASCAFWMMFFACWSASAWLYASDC